MKATRGKGRAVAAESIARLAGPGEECVAVFHQLRPNEGSHPASKRRFHCNHARRAGAGRQGSEREQAGGDKNADSAGAGPALSGKELSNESGAAMKAGRCRRSAGGGPGLTSD